jgi:alpha-glucosidase
MQYISILIIHSFLFFTQVYSQSTASEQVSHFTISAPQLDTTKTIWVYLPKSYANSNKSYPVIYMHDAQNLFDAKTSYVGEWQVDEFLDGLSQNESIVIGIEHGNEKRTDELTPFKNEKYGGGKGDGYIQFIKNNLKTYIDSTYRTLSDAKNTSLFGASLGGLISFYGVIKHPETFGKAGVFSPSFWFNPEIYEWVKNTEISEKIRLYFLAGTDESDSMVTDQKRMVDLLITKGLDKNKVESVLIEGGKHNETLWKSNFELAYFWLYN